MDWFLYGNKRVPESWCTADEGIRKMFVGFVNFTIESRDLNQPNVLKAALLVLLGGLFAEVY